MYKLARYIFVFILLTAIAYHSSAQLRGPFYQQRMMRRQSKIEQVREAYLSRRLALSAGQSNRFWPVYRKYQDALTAIRDKIRINNSQQVPDGQQQVENNLQYQTDMLNVRRYYTNEFLRILTPQQVSEMNKAEKEFQDELIRQLKERQNAINPPSPVN